MNIREQSFKFQITKSQYSTNNPPNKSNHNTNNMRNPNYLPIYEFSLHISASNQSTHNQYHPSCSMSLIKPSMCSHVDRTISGRQWNANITPFGCQTRITTKNNNNIRQRIRTPPVRLHLLWRPPCAACRNSNLIICVRVPNITWHTDISVHGRERRANVHANVWRTTHDYYDHVYGNICQLTHILTHRWYAPHARTDHKSH